MAAYRKIFMLSLLLVWYFTGHTAETLTVMVYNLENYFLVAGKGTPRKSEQSKEALVEVISRTRPDIIVFSEMGGVEALEEMVALLKGAGMEYPFSDVMHGVDPSRCLGFASKREPSAVKKVDNLTYKLTPKFDDAVRAEDVGVQRGFLHLVYDIEGYELNIVGAHLKARVFHWRYNQTDMRRMEARLLKYYVNDIISADPAANVLVAGDLNDVYSANPLVTLRGTNERPERRLYDLKPADENGETWTHWWKGEDTYGRIDYLLASPSLLPEIVFSRNKIAHVPETWVYASDHRPLIAVIELGNRPGLTEEKINTRFRNGVYIGN